MAEDDYVCLWGPLFKKSFLNLLVVLSCEIGYRLLSIIYEYFKNKQRYSQNSLEIIIKFAFTFKLNYLKELLILFFIAIYYATESNYNLQYIINATATMFIPYSILRACNFTNSKIELAKWIRSSSGLDYATGMASNYFHGYLHLQLPDTGHSTKGIKERLLDYEDKHRVKVPIKRLFIIIPNSLHTKPKIQSKIMKTATALESVELNRAGVERRAFKVAVYKIEGNESWYVAVEGATPLLSFYEAMMNRITSTSEMVSMQREITLQFYKSLKKMIHDCPDTRGLVELVYYNEVTSDNQDVDVGEVLKERIKHLIAEGVDDI